MVWHRNAGVSHDPLVPFAGHFRLGGLSATRPDACRVYRAAAYGRVKGANERIGVAFLGAGGRCQAHIKVLNQLHREQGGVEAVAVCDVWDGNDKVKRGLYYSAEKCGLKTEDKAHVTKDYRRILDLKEVDVVCIASPDHWHALIMIEAVKAGLDVWVQKPISRDVLEGRAMVETAHQHGRVVQVGFHRVRRDVQPLCH